MATDTAGLREAKPQYRRGQAGAPGEAAQLPYGQATGLNDASAGVPTNAPTPEIALQQGQMTQPPPPSGVGPQAPPYRPASDEERYLFAPSERPNEPITSGLFRGSMDTPPPEVYENLELLRLASSDPTASPQIRFIHDLLLRYVQ